MPPAPPDSPTDETRRAFLKKSAVAGAMLASARLPAFAAVTPPHAATPTAPTPWYRRTLRWGQTNITEIDPTRYDVKWWRAYWKRTAVQGVVINAGGIVAYYPTQVPLHRRAEFLGDRDLFGELCRAAHDDGLAVFARMDSNSAHEDFYHAHPDWFALDANGRPYRNRELYVSCVNSPYYTEHIPALLREIATLYRPEGFADNSWSGLARDNICFCANCRDQFLARSGRGLPQARNWNDPAYRAWIEWNYARRLEIWDANNRITREAGGPDCLWVGMNGGTVTAQCQQFRDFKEICARAELILLDEQRRANDTGFPHNGAAGALVHGLLGWDKVMPESMAMYQITSQAPAPTFRLTAKPAPEARLWMLNGFAGGIQPWWHHVGAWQEDRRAFKTAGPVMQWHQANEEFLVNRRPLATIGVVWSQRHTDFFGRDDPELMVDLPARGVMQALVRARIPFVPVHLDHIERDAAQFRALILPNLAAMSDAQAASLRRFVQAGGGLFATGQSSLCDEWGDVRADFALADLLGVHLPAGHDWRDEAARRRLAGANDHTYLRLTPPLGARMDGPHTATEPPAAGSRYPALRGFDETDILAFGGTLTPVMVDPGAQVLLTFIPPFPAFPPELSWMRVSKTDIPGLIVNEPPNAGRVAWLAADLDRRYARDNLPDHADLLANLVRWVARDDIPLTVTGPGLFDCHLYRQPARLVLHLVNLTNPGACRAPVEELVAVGPIQVAIRMPDGIAARELRLLVAGGSLAPQVQAGWIRFELKSVLDHEVVVIG